MGGKVKILVFKMDRCFISALANIYQFLPPGLFYLQHAQESSLEALPQAKYNSFRAFSSACSEEQNGPLHPFYSRDFIADQMYTNAWARSHQHISQEQPTIFRHK